ncbi:unnamed protein product [Aspergillus oryzae]|uniref:Unnamed protein product n=2 Tax=Aspergillus oryzae TaxID=5062 RepID=A0AAN4YLB5_ASPOZ|nr:unnamed protein product [Aspergillus oryzae]GMF83208.1 unnamed protein product [Aspergillus oryzae]GMG02042.1 unnamed protein product [Aspergillus oryzae]GMG31710.1 unnamed protein product [Aspergillus oryzae]GMG41627.1 unnamed protein product [Aspergillus oryzae var. brunneus]
MTPQRGLSRSVTGGVRNDLDRYWGDSSPYEELTAETLQYLTLEQSILDLTHFAETVQLEFDTSNSSNAPKAVRSSPHPDDTIDKSHIPDVNIISHGCWSVDHTVVLWQLGPPPSLQRRSGPIMPQALLFKLLTIL